MGVYRTQKFTAIKDQPSTAVSTQRQNNLKAIVNNFITVEASGPEIRIIATPETPGPVESAYIVINLLYNGLFY